MCPKSMRVLPLFLFLILAFQLVFGKPLDTIKVYSHAAVVSAYPIASQVGVDILKKGGSVVDAAIGVQFALAVVFPQAGNIGGGGFMMIRNQGQNAHGKRSDPHYFALDYRETAPKLAGRNMYLDSHGEVLKGESTEGLRASGIPGAVDGMVQAYARFGHLPWKDLVEPAVRLAREGFILTEQEAASLNHERNLFLKYNGPLCAFVKAEGEWKPGDRLIQPDLANTLSLIAEKGRAGFYEGEVANRLVEQMKAPLRDSSKGLIRLEDLKNYKAIWREPLIGSYKKYKIITMPPPSSGGITLFQILSMVEPFPISRYGFGSVSYVHLTVEAQRRAFADRTYYLGDPDFVDMPLKTLLSKSYLRKRFLDFDSLKATPSEKVKQGEIEHYATIQEHIRKEKEETTHFSVADSNGNAVSVTTTLNGGFGSAVVASGDGFLLNNEMDDFSVKPGVPNLYGLIGGETNAIQPGKRMLSSMTPTLVDSAGLLYMVVGSPGGSTIPNTVYQTLMNVLEFRMSMPQAVASGRFHSQWLPDKIILEKGALNESTLKELEKEGHSILVRGGMGRCDAIRINKNGKIEPGADPRGDDQGFGY